MSIGLAWVRIAANASSSLATGILVATAMLLSSVEASAAPVFYAGSSCGPNLSGDSPVSVAASCPNIGAGGLYGTASSGAVAGAGAVGAYATARQFADTGVPTSSAGLARFHGDSLVFSRLDDSLPELFSTSMRVRLVGKLTDEPNSAFGYWAEAMVEFSASLISRSTLQAVRRNGQFIFDPGAFTILEDNSNGQTIDLLLATPRVQVLAGQLESVSLDLLAGALTQHLAGNYAESMFGNTAMFPLDGPVFDFFDVNGRPVNGYTANAGDYIVNNRYLRAGDNGNGGSNGVPEPNSLALLAVASLGLIGSARRRRSQ